MSLKIQYLGVAGIPLENEDSLERYIETHLISKRDALNFECYTELIYNDRNILIDFKINAWGEYEDNTNDLSILRKNKIIGDFKYPDFKENTFFHFVESKNGVHSLGGDVPKKFKIPNNNFPNSFQYIGCLSNSDNVLSWLPFDFHIICPIYLGFYRLWLDYSNPLNPKIVNDEEMNKAYSDGILKPETEVIFEKVKFSLKKANGISYKVGSLGIPGWTQEQLPPICPKSGKTLKFLCQLNSNNGVKVKSYTLSEKYNKKESCHNYFKEMAFSVDWQLYVFFQPETKIACLEIAY